MDEPVNDNSSDTPGTFNSSSALVPAVAATGTNGAMGIQGTSDTSIGVQGTSSFAPGVYGYSPYWGIYGYSETGPGIYGYSDAGPGVSAASGSNTGIRAISNKNIGVASQSSSTIHPAIYGYNPQYIGVYGLSDSQRGVAGQSGAGVGTSGFSNSGKGVEGQSNSGVGVYGYNVSTTLPTGYFVNEKSTQGGKAGYFEGSVRVNQGATNYPALTVSSSGLGWGSGIQFQNSGQGGKTYGIYSKQESGSFHFTDETQRVDRMYISSTGDVYVTGDLYARNFHLLVDHPLDPANKSLSHAFVSSPDMKSIYDGVVNLDDNGEAEIILPSWFEALNTEFRYQLTALGASAPNLYIAQEVKHNCFRIAGGVARIKVCWQVTGIRQDAWAKENPIPFEEDKSAEQCGQYYHPEVSEFPKERAIEPYLASSPDLTPLTDLMPSPDLAPLPDPVLLSQELPVQPLTPFFPLQNPEK